MGNRFFESIRQVSIFLIGTQMILHLKPAKEYEKYIKFLVNLMALSIVLVPLLKLFCGNGEAAFDEKLAAYEKNFGEDLAAIELNEEFIEEKRDEFFFSELYQYCEDEKPQEGIEEFSIEVKTDEGENEYPEVFEKQE